MVRSVSDEPSREPRKRTRSDVAPSRFRLMRSAHIFASSVHELEARLLRGIAVCPITLSQFHLLKLIALNGRHQVGEVAGFLGVSAPAVTKNIDKLERLGLVARAPSPGDRRATLLAASQRGRTLVKAYERAKRDQLVPVLDGFLPQEVEQLTGLLERFSLALVRMEPDADGPCLRCAAYVQEGCPVAEVRGSCPYQERRRDGRAEERQ